MTRWILLVAAACGHPGIGARSAVAPLADPGQPGRDAEIAARAAPFVDAFSDYAAVLAPDGQLGVVSACAGRPQRSAGTRGAPDRRPGRRPGRPGRLGPPRLRRDGKAV